MKYYFVCLTCKRHFKYGITLLAHNESNEHKINVINSRLEDYVMQLRKMNMDLVYSINPRPIWQWWK